MGSIPQKIQRTHMLRNKAILKGVKIVAGVSVATIIAFGILHGVKFHKQETPSETETVIETTATPTANSSEEEVVIVTAAPTAVPTNPPAKKTNPDAKETEPPIKTTTEPNIVVPTDPVDENKNAEDETENNDNNSETEEQTTPEPEENEEEITPDIKVSGRGYATVEEISEN